MTEPITLDWTQADEPLTEKYHVEIQWEPDVREVEMKVWFNDHFIHAYRLRKGAARDLAHALLKGIGE